MGPGVRLYAIWRLRLALGRGPHDEWGPCLAQQALYGGRAQWKEAVESCREHFKLADMGGKFAAMVNMQKCFAEMGKEVSGFSLVLTSTHCNFLNT